MEPGHRKLAFSLGSVDLTNETCELVGCEARGGLVDQHLEEPPSANGWNEG